MRVALIHSFYSSQAPSGENNAVMAQLAALEKKGHEVLLVAKHTDDEAKVPFYKLRSAINVSTQRGASPLAALSDFDPDIVHVHNLFPNFAKSWLGAWSGPLVATLHNFRPVCAAGTLFRNGDSCTECIDMGSHRSIINRCYRGSSLATVPLAIQTRSGVNGDPVINRADRIIVLAQRAYDMYTALGVEKAKLALISNFVDEGPFMPSAPPGEHWTYIGRLSTEKGLLTLMDWWPREQELRIYGEGSLLEEVKQRAAIASNIQFFGGVPSAEVPKILAESRGLVFPSECPEGAPLVYLEALAAGRPVVARRGNSVGDDVAANDTGLAYSDEEELHACLKTASQNWSKHHINAIDRFTGAFSLSAWTEQIENVYEEVIQGVRRT